MEAEENLIGVQQDNIRFCEESGVPTRKVRKIPWINRDIKLLLNSKKKPFTAGCNGIPLNKFRGSCRGNRGRVKYSYKNKNKGKRQQSNASEVWSGIGRLLAQNVQPIQPPNRIVTLHPLPTGAAY